MKYSYSLFYPFEMDIPITTINEGILVLKVKIPCTVQSLKEQIRIVRKIPIHEQNLYIIPRGGSSHGGDVMVDYELKTPDTINYLELLKSQKEILLIVSPIPLK